MAGRLAILACGGDLPVALYKANPGALVITLEGVESKLVGVSQPHRLEEIGVIFEAMRAGGVDRMVFAGALTRPKLNPTLFDSQMMAIAPRLMAAMSLGDDGLLRTVVEIFEEQGFTVLGIEDVLPQLIAGADLALGPHPSEEDEADIARAADILRGIASLDIGQGCVVAGGQCLGIETVQGTDALLGFVAATPEKYRQTKGKGVYVKAAKEGQDLRMDMPTIGPDTVRAVAKAGLGGMIVQTDHVLILDRYAVLQAVKDAKIYLHARTL